MQGEPRSAALAALMFLASLVLPPLIPAQLITAGALRGTVRDAEGEPLSGAAVTIEDQGGGSILELTSGDDGEFAVRMMQGGSFNLLVEAAGYQPVRVRGVIVAAGRSTNLVVELIERPPPITSVAEVSQTGTPSGPTGRIVLERELRTLDFRPDATDLSRGVSTVAS